MAATQTYSTQINLAVPGRDDLAVVYREITDVPGLSAEKVAYKAAQAAQAEVPDGTLVGYRVTTDGTVTHS